MLQKLSLHTPLLNRMIVSNMANVIVSQLKKFDEVHDYAKPYILALFVNLVVKKHGRSYLIKDSKAILQTLTGVAAESDEL